MHTQTYKAMPHQGFGPIQKVEDLLQKLLHDLERLETNHQDVYAAYDFFVTAEHMLDWVFPGYELRKDREALREQEPLLQVTSHIASGSKHFVVQAAHHTAVYHVDCPSDPMGQDELIVTLEGEAAARLGITIRSVDLAHRVYIFWEGYVKELHNNAIQPTCPVKISGPHD